MTERTNIILNSTMLYIIAFMMTTFLHETAHALIGWLYHSDPVMYHNYVQHLTPDLLSIPQQVNIALAGPIMSLIQGFLAAGIFAKYVKRSLPRLLFLWLSILGFFNFFGYVMTGPFSQIGDIGKVYVLLNISITVQIVFAIIAATALLYIAYKITAPFLSFSYKKVWVDSSKSRRHFSFAILILPWLVGSITFTLIYLPIIALISVIYPFTSGMIFIFPWQNASRIEPVKLTSDAPIGLFSTRLLILFIISVLLFRVLVGLGIAF